MSKFNQEEFLREHIPYRIQQLEFGKHAIMILNRLGHEEDVVIRFSIGYEMRAKVAALTNSWLEIGLMASRNMIDFLTGKNHRDEDVTIELFTNINGQFLGRLTEQQISNFGVAQFSLPRRLEAVRHCRNAAAKGVAHLTFHDVRRPDDLLLYRLGIEAILEATLASVYDRLGIKRPQPSIRHLSRSAGAS
jgi:hypothetical protein